MADVVSNVLLRFKADTKDAKKKIKGLQTEQKKMAQESLKNAERQNASLDAQITRWGKIAAGIGAAVIAMKGLQRAAQVFAKRSQLELASVGANIGGIQKAANGLLTEMEALTFAAAAMNTDFKASQKEMEDVAKFMVILRNQGNDWVDVQKEVTKALVEGKTEGLEKFGISIRGFTPGAEAFAAVMKRIKEEVAAVGTVTDVAGDEALRAGVKWQDSIDRLVAALGRLAVALTPIVEALGFIVGGVSQLFNIGDFFSRERAIRKREHNFASRKGLFFAAEKTAALTRRSLGAFGNAGATLAGLEGQRASSASRDRPLQLARSISQGIVAGFRKAEKFKRGTGAGRDRQTLFAGAQPGNLAGISGPGSLLLGAGAAGGAFPGLPGAGGPFGAEAPLSAFGQARGLEGALGGGGRGLLEQLGGPNDAQIEANRMLAASFAQMKDIGVQAFQQLASAGGEMFASMLDGTELVSGGFKAMMGNILHSMSAQMFGLAITEGVMALVELAKGVGGNPKGFAAAAVHGKAAAAAAGAGVAVAGMARAFGGGGQSAGGGALPAAAAGAVGGGAAGGGGSNVTIFVGSDFEENPRGRAQRLKRAFDRAQTLEGDDTIVLPE